MKKYVFYPILFSINPILLMFAVNISDLSVTQLFPIILITPLLALGLVWLFYKIFKDIHRAGFIVFLLIFWFYYYVPVRLAANTFKIGSILFGSIWIYFPIWCLLFLFLSSGWIWKRIKSPETITMFLNTLSIILISLSIFRISTELIPRYNTRKEVSQNNTITSGSIDKNKLPDIYYIILDGYAREDILKELYNYDNSEFITELKNRDFLVAEQSQSNYMQTVLSLASSLNMDYLTGTPTKIINHGKMIGMIKHNRAQLFLQDLGYKYLAFSSGYPPTDITNAEFYYSPPKIGKSHDLEALLMINSILAPFIDKGWIAVPFTRFNEAQERVKYIFESLKNEVPLIEGPKYIFAHIVAPHPPFIFDQNGAITPDEVLILQGADTFPGTIDEYKRGYISDLTYLNKQVIQTIDGILANSNNPPIIILQADHGPDAYFGMTLKDNTCLKERFSILNAYHLPSQSLNQIPEDITPINTFRIIFNTYFGTQFDILPNHNYFATWENPYPIH